MSEHHPDMEQIMALAAGRLPPDEAARIEAALDSDARKELAAQRAALEALAGLPSPTISTGERTRLRAAVRSELGIEAAHRVRQARRKERRRAWLTKSLPALAAVASLVAVVAIAANLVRGPSSDDEPAPTGAPTTAAATTAMVESTEGVQYAATTTAAAPATAATPTEAPAYEAPYADAAEQAAMAEEEMALEEAPQETATATNLAPSARPTTTLRVTDTTAPFAGDERRVGADFAFAFSTDRPDDALLFTDAVIVERGEEAFAAARLAELAEALGLVCWEHAAEAAAPGDVVSFMAYGLVDGYEGEAYRIEDGSAAEGDDPVIHLFAYPDCRPVYFETR